MDKEEVKPTGASRQTEIAEPGFTPGPWQVKEHRVPGYERTIDVIAGNLRVCEVTGGGVSNPKVLATVRANARLLAAAPDLYEAAREADMQLSRLMRDDVPVSEYPIITRLRAALALVDGPLNQETKQMDNEQIERIEIEDEERCEDCGCTPDEGACVYCKMD